MHMHKRAQQRGDRIAPEQCEIEGWCRAEKSGRDGRRRTFAQCRERQRLWSPSIRLPLPASCYTCGQHVAPVAVRMLHLTMEKAGCEVRYPGALRRPGRLPISFCRWKSKQKKCTTKPQRKASEARKKQPPTSGSTSQARRPPNAPPNPGAGRTLGRTSDVRKMPRQTPETPRRFHAWAQTPGGARHLK